MNRLIEEDHKNLCDAKKYPLMSKTIGIGDE